MDRSNLGRETVRQLDQLQELWRTTIPGDTVNVYLCDPASNSLFVGDGWGVAYSALRLHRLDLSSGKHLADVRTRHQGVSALALHNGFLYAATDSRLFELQISDLSPLRQWSTGLVRYTMQLVPEQSYLVAANWRKPTIGLVDLASGRTRRLKVGLQPVIFRYGEELRVIAGYHGGMWRLEVDGLRLTSRQATPPVASVTVGDHIWACLAGAPEGGQGKPPVWTKHGTNVIARLTGSPWTGKAAGKIRRLANDRHRGVVWCLTGDYRDLPLEAVSQNTGRVVASYSPPPRLGVGFCHVAPEAGIALMAEGHHVTRENILVSSSSTLFCYALPDISG